MPDLIIGNHLQGDTTYNGDPDALAAIAPTVLLADSADVDDLMEQLGPLSGLPQRVAEQRDRWQTRLAEARGTYANQGLRAVHIRYTQRGPVELFDPATIPTWAGLLAATAGQVVREDPARNSLVCHHGCLETLDYLAPILARTSKVT